MRILGLVLGVLLAVIVAAWVIGDLLAKKGMQTVGEEAWPAGLGTLASVEARFPPQKTNDAARRMVALAEPLGIPFELTSSDPDPLRIAITEYVKAEQVRGEAVIGEPPTAVAAYLGAHESAIDALREHLLHGEAIVWDRDLSRGFDAPIPNLAGHMNVARLFTARALIRGRAGDVRAWGDLHAAWRIAQSLEPRPELVPQMVGLAVARIVNAAAWKLPQSSDSAWFAEVQRMDHRRLLLGAFQTEMWVTWRNGEQASTNGAMGVLSRPYFRWSIVDMARRQRRAAEELASKTTCSADPVTDDAIPRWNVIANLATPNLDGAWRRVFRTLAEREAATNAMRIADGQPIVAKSACSDGAWRIENARLAFNLDLPQVGGKDTAMPLSLAIPARGTRRSI